LAPYTAVAAFFYPHSFCFATLRRPQRFPPLPTRRSSDLSTCRFCPTVKPETGLARNTTAAATSSGVPSRPMTHCSSASRYASGRSEEHTSELQSRENLVCRLLLEKKKKPQRKMIA